MENWMSDWKCIIKNKKTTREIVWEIGYIEKY